MYDMLHSQITGLGNGDTKIGIDSNLTRKVATEIGSESGSVDLDIALLLLAIKLKLLLIAFYRYSSVVRNFLNCNYF